LSYDASESDIEELFKGIGPVRSVEVVYNKHTHRSKGYGFVEMLRIDEAKRAVEVLHDQHFMGRQMIVSGAKAKNAEEAEAASIAREQKEQDAAAASSAPAVSAAPVTHSEPAVAPEQEQAPAAATEQVELPLATAEVDGVVEEVHSLDSTHQKETFV
jgi:RNA recognition motif-containing protein